MRLADNRGLTLIETVISVMIIAMVSVAIASVLISTTMAYKKAELRQTSLFMIKTVSEKLRDFIAADTAVLPAGLSSGGYAGLCDDSAPLSAGALHDMSCYFDMPYGPGSTLRDKFPTDQQMFGYVVSPTSCCSSCDASLVCRKVDFFINYLTG